MWHGNAEISNNHASHESNFMITWSQSKIYWPKTKQLSSICQCCMTCKLIDLIRSIYKRKTLRLFNGDEYLNLKFPLLPKILNNLHKTKQSGSKTLNNPSFLYKGNKTHFQMKEGQIKFDMKTSVLFRIKMTWEFLKALLALSSACHSRRCTTAHCMRLLGLAGSQLSFRLQNQQE